MQHLLGLESKPERDHAADALAAAICFANYDLASLWKGGCLMIACLKGTLIATSLDAAVI